MSEAPLTARPNAQILEEAAAWFVEFQEGGVALEAREAFAIWLKASPEHVRAYLKVSGTFDELGRLGRHRTGDAEALIQTALASGNVVSLSRAAPDDALQASRVLAGEAPRAPRRSFARGFARAARVAVLAVAIGALGYWLYSQRVMYSTGTGEQRIVNLADGSTIELDAQSRIRVRLTDHDRVVDLLEGQALFHVAKDTQRPFRVKSGGTTVRAVGTQFDVNRQPNDTVVTVLEGRVAIARTPDAGASAAAERAASSTVSIEAAPLYASAGEQVIVTAQAASRSAHPDVAAATAWRERKLVFSSSPLPVVVGEYNRYHEKRLRVADPALADFKISGIFSAADAASLIAFLRAQSNIDVEERESEIVLKSK